MVVVAKGSHRTLKPLPAADFGALAAKNKSSTYRPYQASTFEAPPIPPAEQLASLINKLNAEAAGQLNLTTEQLAAAPKLFRCQASECLLTDPVVLCDGNTYQRDIVVLWFQLHGATTPISGIPLTSKAMATNYAAKSMIESWSHDGLVSYLEKECPAAMNCAISCEPMDNPVISLESGQSYQRKFILKWFGENSKASCPLTRETITKSALVENKFIQQAWSLRVTHILQTRKASGLRRLISFFSSKKAPT